jgi:hypothetical protein
MAIPITENLKKRANITIKTPVIIIVARCTGEITIPAKEIGFSETKAGNFLIMYPHNKPITPFKKILSPTVTMITEKIGSPTKGLKNNSSVIMPISAVVTNVSKKAQIVGI